MLPNTLNTRSGGNCNIKGEFSEEDTLEINQDTVQYNLE